MKERYKLIVVVLNLVILLGYFGYSVYQKEATLANGKLVLLKLAPVDPRSLMQGDYMRLRYEIADNMRGDSIPKRGYCVVLLDSNGVVEWGRFQEDKIQKGKNELFIKYTANGPWNINIGAESFFFQEGQADKYSVAKYGALRVDGSGNSVLVGLYNEQLKQIE